MEFLTKIKRVLATHYIADHIEDFTSLTKRDDHLAGKCPLCREEKFDSLLVYPDLRFYFCQTCESSGDVIAFIQKMHGVELVEAVNLLEMGIPNERIGTTRGTRHDVPQVERDRRDHAWGVRDELAPEIITRPVWRLEEWEL